MQMSVGRWGLLACVLAFFLAGCAAKNSGAKVDVPSTAMKRGSSSSDSSGNPILFEEEYEAAQKGELPNFDIPVVRNAKVEQWLVYFQGRGRKWYHLWLERSGRYIPFMKKILKDHDLPEDLVYLAMIESGFSPKAFSRARASGPWQFMKSTGRLYGLRADFWVDERRDPEKSTIAAARHLKDLYDQFQSWKLAAAAYNAGPAKVSRAIRRYKTEDFWELTKGHYLRPETRHYVPKLIAAALIAKEPSKYGFTEIHFEDPLSYDKIILKDPVNLAILSQKAGYSLEDLMTVNPELNHPVTPPGVSNYELRVPSGTSQKFVVAYNSLSDEEKFQYTAHLVRRGDTLARLSRLYGVPGTEIAKLNSLKSAKRLKVGRTLLIPVPLGLKLASMVKRAQEEETPLHKKRISRLKGSHLVADRRRTPEVEDAVLSDGKRVHIVKAGESLWEIAQNYGVTVIRLKHLNRLHRNQILPGKRLAIPEG